jgi:hypothetical protein
MKPSQPKRLALRRFTAAEREEIRRQEAKLLGNIDKLPPERQLIAQIAARGRRIEKAKKAKVPEVGLFFVVDWILFVDGLPWTEAPSVAGFRTYGVGHPEYWRRLQVVGAAPKGMPYGKYASGRVTYEDASRKFTLFADRCIIRNKRLVSKIINERELSASPHYLKRAGNPVSCPRKANEHGLIVATERPRLSHVPCSREVMGGDQRFCDCAGCRRSPCNMYTISAVPDAPGSPLISGNRSEHKPENNLGSDGPAVESGGHEPPVPHHGLGLRG